MRIDATVINTLWWSACLPGAVRFAAAARRMQQSQTRLLLDILHRNAGTRFGLKHGFSEIHSIEEYRRRVPLVRYDDILPWIEEIAHGKPNVLFTGRPQLFEPTSGSAAPSKLVPYTAALRSQFQAAIAPWIFGMYLGRPGLLCGRAYWSISPSIDRLRTEGGIPVGFNHDTEYLNPMLRRLLDRTMAVPPEAGLISDPAMFRRVTLTLLLGTADLTLISIWNPTFLTLLLSSIAKWSFQLTRDVETGKLPVQEYLPPRPADRLVRFIRRNPRRADEIRRILNEGDRDGVSMYERLWPNLKAISCWTDGPAGRCAETLRKYFPNTAILPKGLVSTEGIVSFPLSPEGQAVPALRSHFLEFIPEPDQAAPRLSWELKKGGEYSVVITTGGGLYRYCLDDRVRVTGFKGNCPILQFVGKNSRISDLYGEKLNEAHVAKVLEEAFLGLSHPPDFALLAPDGTDVPDRYTLLLSGHRELSSSELEAVRLRCEIGLTRNIHYEYCRKVGQLQDLTVHWLVDPPEQVMARYQARHLSRGRRAGDIKPAVLDGEMGWRQQLQNKNGAEA